MLNSLSFEITTPSALRFGERFMKVARASPQVRLLSLYLMESSLLHYKFLRHLPSLVAASSLCIALRTINGRDGNWVHYLTCPYPHYLCLYSHDPPSHLVVCCQ
jgi:cyclin A